MPKKKNTTLRLLVPVIGFLAVIGVGIAMSVGTKKSTAPKVPVPVTTPDSTQDLTAQADPADQGSSAQSESVSADQAQADTAQTDPAQAGTPEEIVPPAADLNSVDLTGLVARADPAAPVQFDTLGSLDQESPYEFAVDFTPFGAGVGSLKLTHEFDTVAHLHHYELQSMMRGNTSVSVDPDDLDDAMALVLKLGELPADHADRPEAMLAASAALTDIGFEGYIPELSGITNAEDAKALQARADGWVKNLIVPFALLAVDINGQRVFLANVGEGGRPLGVWSQTAPGEFVATIENGAGESVARVRRAFAIRPDSHGLTLTQTLENLTDAPLDIRWIQTGPIDPAKSKNTYGGDKRRFRFGYLLNPEAQAGDPTVLADNELRHHREFLGKKTQEVTDAYGFAAKGYTNRETLWPTTKATKKEWRLVWAGFTDRYFAIAMHPIVRTDTPIGPDAKVFSGITSIDRLVLNPAASNTQNTTVVLDLKGPELEVLAGETARMEMGIYAGPMTKPLLAAEPMPVVLGLDRIIIYNFGSCTSACTFGWLTHLLLEVLRLNHWVTGDWALAIILLVVMVRTTLHPITRWSQIKMQRFGAQMQGIGPKQVKLKEKYKDDPRKLQQETSKLWKEEGISPAGFLGCLPMFLQSPVWIALYATLFFAAELRHEPGFYGIFQTISNGHWGFLADLSAPDAALPLGRFAFTPPIIGNFTGVIDTINILPLLMGFVFYAHQKYLTPPTTTTLTPEQKSQQKMIKMMSVVMFPLIMYPAPSGLAIYFVTNSTIAIFENRHIRSHMKKHGLLDPDKIKAARANKKPGFLARLQRAAEAQAKAKAEAQNQGRGYGTGKNRGGKAPKPAKKTINRQYKKKS